MERAVHCHVTGSGHNTYQGMNTKYGHRTLLCHSTINDLTMGYQSQKLCLYQRFCSAVCSMSRNLHILSTSGVNSSRAPWFSLSPTKWIIYLLLFYVLLPHCVNFSTFVEAKSRREVKFRWRAGSWDECEGTSCGHGGVQLRSVNCVYADKKDWRVIHSHCDKESKPTDQRPCFKVCDEHRDMYRWQAGEWQECKLADSAPVPDDAVDVCGLGFVQIGSQLRNISCVSVDDPSVYMENYVCEKFSLPPLNTYACDVPCPINCVTSQWSEWNRCSKTCGNGTRYRTRSVMTTAEYGGADCPRLSETQSCPDLPACDIDPIIQTFFSKPHVLKFGNWTDCRPGHIQLSSPSNGRRKSKKDRKKLATIRMDLIGRRERHVICLNEDGISLGDSVTVTETCTTTKNCDTHHWTEWSPCTTLCGKTGNRTRTREIRTLPTGPGARDCPHLEEIEQCEIDASRVRDCKKYTWVTGGWNECQTVNNATCGGGTHERDVYCVVKDEFTIYQASTAVAIGGKVGLKEWAKMRPVDDANCDQMYKPSIWEECDVQCAATCEVGEWSDWSECSPEVCVTRSTMDPDSLRSGRRSTNNAFKRRVRKILQSSNEEDGCLHKTEVIPCEDAKCFRWHPVSVSHCIAASGSCGEGTQVQSYVCRDIWGGEVDDDNCRREPDSPTINSTLLCHVSCGSDCVLSEWSTWTPCTHVCKRGRRESGNQTRFREVLANPGPDGRKCPNERQLQDSRLCNQHRCSVYYWNVGAWSACQVKDSVTPTVSAAGIRSTDMFMSDDGNTTGGQHKALSFPAESTIPVCGVGYQIREVACQKKDSLTVQDKLCGSKQTKPLISRDCTFPCPRDCVVSEWGRWTDCEAECDKLAKPGFGSPGPVYQWRHRVVVQHRTDRGTPCPIELQQRRQCIETEKCMLFRWHASKWTDCVMISKASSIFSDEGQSSQVMCVGAMTRRIQCRQFSSNGESLNVEDRLCVKYADRSPPEGSRYCIRKCKADLNFADWQQKIGCLATVKSVVESVEEYYVRRLDPKSEQSYVALQKTAKPVGGWSSCNITKPFDPTLASLMEKRNSIPYCGNGFRRRALACYVEGTDVIVDNSHCHYRNFQEESCEIPCPVDCTLSPWSSWGRCGDRKVGRRETSTDVETVLPCGENLKMRYQYSVTEPKHGGRACPIVDSLGLTYETQPCRTVCNTMSWVPYSWRKCEVEEYGTFSNCGSGLQSRDVKCFQSDRGTGYLNVANVVTDQRLCNLETMPFGSRSCFSPCPGECVYSDWSSWQSCQSIAGSRVMNSCKGVRKRSRTLLRKADPRSALQFDTSLPDFLCGNTDKIEEVEGCRLNENCFTYSALRADWSSCLLPPGASCGAGRQERRSNCISSNGLPVHKDRCSAHNITLPSPESRSCRVTCSIDCELSSWSEWSRCTTTCDSIVTKTRTRKISRKPSTLGRPCPITIETTPCPPKPCHKWKLGDWSECQIAGGNCGTGLQFRQIKCEQHNGVIVSNTLCQNQQGDLDEWFGDPELRRDCHVACAGECHMTEWSVWSNCHMRCLDVETKVAGVTHGIQTRSRVGFIVGQMSEGECPSQEVAKRPCALEDAKCYIYGWKSGTFHKGKCPVWCERTIDGLNVSFGCHEQLKPQEELYCIQNCDTIPHSYCTNNGVCECDVGYHAVSQSTGTLDACLEMQPNDEAKTIQIVESEIGGLPDVDPRSVEIEKDSQKISVTMTTTEISTPETTTADIVVKKSGFWESLDLFDKDGNLKPWVYGVIAGLAFFLIFLVAAIYLICAACCRKKSSSNYVGRHYGKHMSSGRRKRRHNSSGSNVGVGMVIGMGTPRYPPSNSAMSYTSSTSRSGFHPDQYDSGILWKEA